MFRMSIVLSLVFAVVGCGTPSDVTMNDKDIENGRVVINAWYGYTTPEETAYAQGMLMYNYELTRAMQAVRTAEGDDKIDEADRKLALVRASKLQPPAGPELVTAYVTNWMGNPVEVCCFPKGSGIQYAQVVIPAKDFFSSEGKVATLKLVKGRKYRLEYFVAGTRQFLNRYEYQEPAYEGIPAFIK